MPRYVTQPVKEKGASSAADTQETKHVGKAGRPGSYLGSWTGETGVCAGMGWSRKNVLFLLLCPVSRQYHQHPELTLLAQPQKFAPNWYRQKCVWSLILRLHPRLAP